MGLLFVDGFDDGLALRGKWDQAVGDLTIVNGRNYTGPAEERVEDTDARITYVGTWTDATFADASGGTARYADAADETASLTFTGNGIRWITISSSAQGIAEVFIDDVLVETVDLYTSSTTQWQYVGYENLNLEPGEHTIRIRVTGTKNASSSNTIVYVDAFDVINATSKHTQSAMRLGPHDAVNAPTTLTKDLGAGAHPTMMSGFSFMSKQSGTEERVEDSDARITYVGTWTNNPNTSASGGSTRFSSTADDTASFTFVGTGIQWITFTSPGNGIAEVFLDDVLVATVDLYASSNLYGVVAYENLDLSPGEHTIRVRVTGTGNASATNVYVHIDAFDFVPVSIAPATNLLRFSGDSTDRLRLALNANGTLTAFNGATELGTSIAALTPGQHHYLEARRVISDTAGQALVRLDGAEVINAAIADPLPAEERVENDDVRVSYASGTWSVLSNASASAGTYTYNDSNAAGDTAEFTFTGTSIQWITQRAANRGIAEVFLDGTLVATVDLYAASTQWQVVGYENLNLASGEHTISVRATGTKHASSSGTWIVVDAFDFVPVHVTEQVIINGHDAATGELVVDDLWILNGEGTPAPELLGDVIIETHYPDAAGAYTQMAPSAAGEPNFSMVNNAGNPDDTTYVSSAIKGDRDSYGFSDVVRKDLVKGVQLSALAKQSEPGALSIGLTARTPGTTEARVEDSDASITKVGTWTTNNNTSFSGGSAIYARVVDATASLTFRGSGVRWITYKSSGTAIAEVFIDNVLVATVDTATGTLGYQIVAYENLDLPYGEHTIRIRHTGTTSGNDNYLYVDAFDVIGAVVDADASDSPESLTIDNKPYIWMMEQDPTSAKPWTPAAVSDSEFGVQNAP